MKLPSYTLFFMEELSYVLTKTFLLVFLFAFIFLTAAHFYLAGRSLLTASISHFLTPAMKFSFFFQRNSSPLFLITRSSSFSVIHVSVDIKNNIEQDSTLLLFLLSKSPGGNAIHHQKHLELPAVSYLLIELFYIGIPVVLTDDRSDGRTVT